MSFSAFAIQLTKRNPADYFYSAAEHRSRGALWPIFAPALILIESQLNYAAKRHDLRESVETLFEQNLSKAHELN
jgi:hypothetical protein